MTAEMLLADLEKFKVPMDSVKPFPGNARVGNIEKIAGSIADHKQYRPLVVNIREGTEFGDMTVLAGNQTLKALEQLERDEVYIWYVDVDDEEAREINLIDNATSDDAYNDPELLAILLQKVAKPERAGYSHDFLEDLLGSIGTTGAEELADADEIPEVPQAPVSRTGDVWLLGPHRIICGDSTDPDVVSQAIGQYEEIDFIFTSPPYNVGLAYGQYDDKQKPWDEYRKLLDAVLDAWIERLTDGRMIAWNIGTSPKAHPYRQTALLEEHDLSYFRTIVWEKPGITVPIWQNTQKNPVARSFLPNYKHEMVFLYSKGAVEQGSRVEDDDSLQNDVVSISPSGETHDASTRAAHSAHPAVFPAKLPELFAKRLCDRGKVIADPFMGSGTTIIAAERCGRIGVGAELDPAYVDVICRRYQEFTGTIPVLEATGEQHDFTAEAAVA